MSGEAEKEILIILETSMAREREAADLYQRGAEVAIRPEIVKIFKDLANQEKNHEKILHDLYHQIKKRLGMKIFRPDETD